MKRIITLFLTLLLFNPIHIYAGSDFYNATLWQKYDYKFLTSNNHTIVLYKVIDNDFVKIEAIDIEFGLTIWNKTLNLTRKNISPKKCIITGDKLILFTDKVDYIDRNTPSNLLYCYNLRNGSLMWLHNTINDEAILNNIFCAVGNKIYLLMNDNYLLCVNLETGQRIWKKAIREIPAPINVYRLSHIVDDTLLIEGNYTIVYDFMKEQDLWNTYKQTTWDCISDNKAAGLNVTYFNNDLYYFDCSEIVDNKNDYVFMCRDTMKGDIKWTQTNCIDYTIYNRNIYVLKKTFNDPVLRVWIEQLDISSGRLLKSFDIVMPDTVINQRACNREPIGKTQFADNNLYLGYWTIFYNSNFMDLIKVDFEKWSQEKESLSLTNSSDIIFVNRECIITEDKISNSIGCSDLLGYGNRTNYYNREIKYKLESEAYTVNEKTYFMDRVKPVIHNQSIFIPAKYLVESISGLTRWIEDKKQIICFETVKSKKVLFTLNSKDAYVNGKQVQIDPKNPKITPIIINGRTMVPLRFLAESLGCKVEWKADTKEIIVTYQP